MWSNPIIHSLHLHLSHIFVSHGRGYSSPRAAIRGYPFWCPYDYGWVPRGPTVLFFGWVQAGQVHGTVSSMGQVPFLFGKEWVDEEYMWLNPWAFFIRYAFKMIERDICTLFKNKSLKSSRLCTIETVQNTISTEFATCHRPCWQIWCSRQISHQSDIDRIHKCYNISETTLTNLSSSFCTLLQCSFGIGDLHIHPKTEAVVFSVRTSYCCWTMQVPWPPNGLWNKMILL